MQGKHVVITGPTAGIGRVCALTFAELGTSLTLLCRNAGKAESLVADIEAQGCEKPQVIILDMASLDSVRSAAEEILASSEQVDILLNNAGLVNTSRRVNVDGFEETFAVNHLAPFLLTGLLLPAIKKAAPSRIVNVASDAHQFVRGMGFDDLQAEQKYKTFTVYGRSKLANILFTRELAARLEGSDVTVNCLHPGAVATGIGKQNGGMMATVLPALLKPFFRTPEKGAQTSIYLCTSDEVAGQSGGYYVNCKLTQPRRWARDDQAAAELWSYSESALDFRYPE